MPCTVASASVQDGRERGFSIMGSESGSHHHTLAIAAIALSKIIELQLPADPQSFELWYLYASGQNQKLKGEIDGALQRQGKLSDDDLSRLYAQYISPARDTGDFDLVATRLTDEVGQVVKMISAAVTSVERYDERLQESTAAASNAVTDADLKRVIEGLISATKTIERENSSLKEQLDVSMSRSEQLRHEIEAVRLQSLTDALTQIGNRQYFDGSL